MSGTAAEVVPSISLGAGATPARSKTFAAVRAVQLGLFCSRCSEPAWPGEDLCGLCAWALDDARTFARIKAEVAEDAAAATARELLWWEERS